MEQSNYTTKMVNVYSFYDPDDWPKVPFRNFTLKNCIFFGATTIIKTDDKEKYVCSWYGIAFDG